MKLNLCEVFKVKEEQEFYLMLNSTYRRYKVLDNVLMKYDHENDMWRKSTKFDLNKLNDVHIPESEVEDSTISKTYDLCGFYAITENCYDTAMMVCNMFNADLERYEKIGKYCEATIGGE